MRATALMLACATVLLVSPALIGLGTRIADPATETQSVQARLRATPEEVLAGIDGPSDTRSVVACSRATVADFSGTAEHLLPGRREFPNQLAAIRARRPDVVVLLVGANDIGFPELLDDCLVREAFDCSTDPAIASRTVGLMADLAPRLEALYTRLLDDTGAQVIVPAYPDLLDGSGACGRINGAERTCGRAVISPLNSTIAKAVDKVGRGHRDGDRLRFVPETAAALGDHGPCSDDAWINPYGVVSLLNAAGSSARAQEVLHPTATGYAALSRVLIPHLGG
ncbi:hypothetical protein GCM10023166_20800 [Paeniglutamicibacter cryotolerans]